MNSPSPALALMTLALSFLLPAGAVPQAAQETRATEKQAARSREASKPLEKPRLDGTARVSTEEVARDAARDAAKREAAGAPVRSASESGVLELQPSPKAAGVAKEQKDTRAKGRSLKKVHGTASSSAGASGGREHAASVGASSKTGKAHVYVETERSRAASPPPR